MALKKEKGRFGVGAELRGQVLDRPPILRGSVGPSKAPLAYRPTSSLPNPPGQVSAFKELEQVEQSCRPLLAAPCKWLPSKPPRKASKSRADSCDPSETRAQSATMHAAASAVVDDRRPVYAGKLKHFGQRCLRAQVFAVSREKGLQIGSVAMATEHTRPRAALASCAAPSS